MAQCTFMINPSLSEGGAPATLKVVANGGLIPICSRACGFDMPVEATGIVEDVTYEAFEQKTLEMTAMPAEELRKQSECIYSFIREHNTFEAFRENMYHIIESCVQE